VIISFADHGTEDIFENVPSPDARRTCPVVLWSAARRKMDLVVMATQLGDLAAPSGNRLEKLMGDRAGRWSIRVNTRYRICFRWEDGNAHEVEIVDYHR
jgi:proteic killer suppression protein